ncbi:MAG: carboxypeptidase regulatory-like domain-containing protein, partial [Patescibacteria group bacterium]|nr:carboxypeptidase regulatory-like domain-containing protein [Patescibacteria group bacterium]
PLPHTSFWQSSYYGNLEGPVPNDVLCPNLYGANHLSDQEFYALNETHDTPIYFSQYLTTGNNGSVMAQTMFGRVYVCNNDAHGYLGNSTVLLLGKNQSANIVLTLNRAGAITGKVYNTSKTPIAGITVEAQGAISSNNGLCENSVKQDVTGFDGAFVIPDLVPSCKYEITASDDGYASYFNWFLNPQLKGNELDDKLVLVPKDPAHNLVYKMQDLGQINVSNGSILHHDIVMERDYESGSIAGRITDYHGNAIPNVFVDAYSGDNSNFARGITDDSGNFVINGVKPGTYTVSPGRFPLYAVPAQFVIKDVYNVTVNADMQTHLSDIAAIPSASIKGKVMLSDGTPLHGVTIDLRPVSVEPGYDYFPPPNAIALSVVSNYNTWNTDDGGRYNIAQALPPGRYAVSVIPTRTFLNDSLIELEPVTVTVDAYSGNQTVAPDLTLDYKMIEDYGKYKTVKIYGHVRDGDTGNPVKGMTVYMKPEFRADRTFSIITDKDGSYIFVTRQGEVPDLNNSNWTVGVDTFGGVGMTEIGPGPVDWNNFTRYGAVPDRNIVAHWGEQKEVDFTLYAIKPNTILTSSVHVSLYGRSAGFSLPSKVLLLTVQKDNKSYEMQITTNSTVKGSWINWNNESLTIGLDPIEGTHGVMNIIVPNDLVRAQEILLDGHPTNASISHNGTHTSISLDYVQDFHNLNLVSNTNVPEFPFAALVLLSGIVLLVVLYRIWLRKLLLSEL